MNIDNRMPGAYMQPNENDNIPVNPKPKRKVGLIILIVTCIVVVMGGAGFAALQIKNIVKEQKNNVKKEAKEVIEKNTQYEQGTIEGDTYTSEFLDLKFYCPSDCTMDSEFDNQKMEEMLNLDENEIYQNGKNTSMQELKVSDATGENNFNIIVAVGAYADLKSYADYLKKGVEDIYKDYNAKCDIEVENNENLGNDEYEVFKLEMKFPDYNITLNQWQYIRQIGKYFVAITFTGDKDKFISNFSALD